MCVSMRGDTEFKLWGARKNFYLAPSGGHNGRYYTYVKFTL